VNESYRGGEPVADVVRSGFTEGIHRGSVVVLDASGSIRNQLGDIESPIFPRSANKPMQSVGALRSGLTFTDDADLAIATASHRGEPFHIERVRRILRDARLSESDLQCPADLPSDADARDAVLAAGGGPSPIMMNCSGKHAAMLLTCLNAGWSTDDYLDPEHPLQVANREAVIDLAGTQIGATGIDGCGAPLFAVPLLNLALAFQRFVDAEPGSHERAIADAMRAHPELVSGTHGSDTQLMRAVPGLLSKGGAEGIAAIAVPGVGAVAVKIDDGQHRAAVPVAVAALRTLDLSGLDVDEESLDELAETPLLGGGEPVGAVVPLWPEE